MKVRPLWRELVCDGETPLSAYARLRRRGEASFLLESVVGGERWARYSFVGLGGRARIQGEWERAADGKPELRIEAQAMPGFRLPESWKGRRGIDALAELIEQITPESDASDRARLPRFWGGLVGVWGHELVHELEQLRTEPPSLLAREASVAGEGDASLPVLELLLTDTLVVFDTLSQRVLVIATVCEAMDADPGLEGEAASAQAERRAEARIERAIRALRQPGGLLPFCPPQESALDEPPPPSAGWEPGEFQRGVRRVKGAIEAGEVFQLVLSQRFELEAGAVDPLDVYRGLRQANPSPYMYLLELPSATLAGASPEVLLRLEAPEGEALSADVERGRGPRLTVRPIAGTRPRGKDPAHDLELERELLEDPKERAEHLMLIDLARNDVGRVARPGTVELAESFVIERYSRVMHIVSEVSGEMRPGCDAFDALRAAFPAGTLSGAPKVRALELIDELEPRPRGWYGGAVGYVGFDGAADLAICIRSALFVEDAVRVQAGAGVVYDSDPASEDLECQRKASAVLRAIALGRELARKEGAA